MKCALLTYHRILPTGERGAFHDLDEAGFHRHLETLAQWGRASADGLTLFARQGERAVVLTFDDGTADHARVADWLEARGWRGTFFISPERLGGPERLTPAQVRALAAQGHRIGAHGLTHRRLDRLAPAEAVRELRESRARLEAITLQPVTWFAPPGGLSFPGLEAEATAAGYAVVRGMVWGDGELDPDGALRGRLDCWPMHRNLSPERLGRILDGRAAAWPGRVKELIKRLLGEARYEALRDGKRPGRGR